MLTEIRLINYRGFEDHVIPLKPVTVLVGSNNAGKSSAVEALRFLSIVTARFRSLSYGVAPRWSQLPRGRRGATPSLKGLEFSADGLFHHYGDPPATIIGTFASGEMIEVHLGPNEEVHAVLVLRNGEVVKNRSAAAACSFPRVATMPQVAPLVRREVKLSEDHVRSVADSYLAPQHFRNQLIVFGDRFRTFKTFAEASWPGLQIERLEYGGGLPGTPLSLLLRDGDFVAEVALMGHGLQMWLQTVWFLSRTSDEATVVLDEPDVYMHADLQRRLIRLLRGRYAQVVVATHSLEIMSEMDPDEVCIIERKRKRSAFATTLPTVQRIVERIGGVHNVHLTRLWRAKKCLLVEGDDLDFLAHFQNVLFAGTEQPLKGLPHFPIGGWGGWRQAIGSGLLLKNVMGESIYGLCILDRDYHSADEVSARIEEGHENGLWVHVWERKEIENYVLSPPAILRAIRSRAARRTELPDEAEVASMLASIVQGLRGEVEELLAEEIQKRGKGVTLRAATAKARADIYPAWDDPEERLRLVPGKRAIELISEWSQREFGVGVGAVRIAREMKTSEVPAEVREVMAIIENPRKELARLARET